MGSCLQPVRNGSLETCARFRRGVLILWIAGLVLPLVYGPLPGADTAGAPAAAGSRSIAEIFESVSPAVVGLSCRREREEGVELYYGTGTIIDPTGLVITSTTVIPRDGDEIRVYLREGRVVPGKPVFAEDATELSLLRIEGRSGEVFPHVTLGDSDEVRLGELALTLGNSFQSIERDDQVSLGRGIISGFYKLEPTLSQSKYVGYAIETSAPLNSGTDGGPLISREGLLIGVLSLNYSRSRWLGTAVPINDLKPLIYPHSCWLDDEEEKLPAYWGIRLLQRESGDIRVLSVREGSPATEAGLASGDRIRAVDGTDIETLREFRDTCGLLEPKGEATLEVVRDGKSIELKVRPWRRF